jgi:hypothetical protein
MYSALQTTRWDFAGLEYLHHYTQPVRDNMGGYSQGCAGVCRGVHFQMSNLPPKAGENTACEPERVLLQKKRTRRIWRVFSGTNVPLDV